MDPNYGYDANAAGMGQPGMGVDPNLTAGDQATINQYESATAEEKQRMEEEWKAELAKVSPDLYPSSGPL